MGRLTLAWRVLTNGAFAARISAFLDAPKIEEAVSASRKESPAAPEPVAAKSEKPARNDAISLLATLQREGRLIDFLKEPIDGYSDAQVGAAVRDIHRDCSNVLERQFAIRPVIDQSEGSTVEIGKTPDPGKFKLTGPASAKHAGTGTLIHHGWLTTKCELPLWQGTAETAGIVSPAEVEATGP